jgi:hypothetical protein
MITLRGVASDCRRLPLFALENYRRTVGSFVRYGASAL